MINPIIRIDCDRYYMRPFAITDAPSVQFLLEKNREYMLDWIPWAKDEPESVDIKRKKIRLWTAEFYQDIKYTYGVFDRSTDQLIGIQYLFTRQGPGILEIGYIIDEDQAGKGLATHSSYALTKLSIDLLKPEKMVIICSPDNIASARIPEKLGYHEESQTTTVDKDKHNRRIVLSTWVMFPEQFKHISTYEPIQFIKEDGWD